MSTEIITEWARRIRVTDQQPEDRRLLCVEDTHTGDEVRANINRDAAKALAAALDPDRVSVKALTRIRELEREVDRFVGERDRVVAERDEAAGRAEMFAKVADEHKEEHREAVRRIRGLEASNGALKSDRDRALRAYSATVKRARKANARADLAEARVQELEKAATADPIVYAVRESDLPEVERSDDGRWFVNDEFAGHENITPASKRHQRDVALGLAARHEAVARAIENKPPAPHPVEALAEELWDVGYPHRGPWAYALAAIKEKNPITAAIISEEVELVRRIARHQLERKADQ